ncbi:hypothetical protein V6N12_002125 [Hibiscus sabdariffa]|uniref:Uncharacterized protein n=1 Tax=Hibiscus sabdariffa TaxID=183260 RepID=A0ABR2B2A0_9ROSI
MPPSTARPTGATTVLPAKLHNATTVLPAKLPNATTRLPNGLTKYTGGATTASQPCHTETSRHSLTEGAKPRGSQGGQHHPRGENQGKQLQSTGVATKQPKEEGWEKERREDSA